VRRDVVEWEILICQLITQGGLVTVYPAEAIAGKDKYPNFTVSVTVDAWIAAYELLPVPDYDEKAFDRAYNRLHKSQISALRTAINDERVKSRFTGLKRRPSFGVFYADEGDTSVRDRMKFLWGNRPPKRDFATAKELFEHIFKKAELFPAHSMRLSGKKVIAVNWFGHEFTDRFVDLMEGVTNIASLCDGLSEFVLTATRVTPSGTERLKKLLPRARFTIVSDRDFASGINPWHGRA
jgi:hypothetical protein